MRRPGRARAGAWLLAAALATGGAAAAQTTGSEAMPQTGADPGKTHSNNHLGMPGPSQLGDHGGKAKDARRAPPVERGAKEDNAGAPYRPGASDQPSGESPHR